MIRALLCALLLLTAACSNTATPEAEVAPPRAAPTALLEPPPSQISLPVRVPLALIKAQMEATIPRTLYDINLPDQVCAKPTRVKLFKTRLKVTPTIKCNILGAVTRGPLTLVGKGKRIRLSFPIKAVVRVEDIGGIIKRETATADAVLRADVIMGLSRQGNLTSRFNIDYYWTNEPGVDVLGRRISFAGKADPKLQEMIAKTETELPRRLAQLPVRGEVEKLWRQGFALESLNRENPAAWLTLTPKAIGLSRVQAVGKDLVIDASLTAIARVHLGEAPARPTPTPLPAIGRAEPGKLQLHVPVLAQYQTLEPVIAKALTKVSAKGIKLGEERINARFGPPLFYGTAGGRVALGLDLAVSGPRKILDTQGRVWLTARPETAPGSERVLIRDIQLATARPANIQLPLLAAVATSPDVRTELEGALSQDFSKDYAKLMVKIEKALQAVKIGNFRLSVKLDQFEHGSVVALGQGLHMPVTASGTARLDYASPPRR